MKPSTAHLILAKTLAVLIAVLVGLAILAATNGMPLGDGWPPAEPATTTDWSST